MVKVLNVGNLPSALPGNILNLLLTFYVIFKAICLHMSYIMSTWEVTVVLCAFFPLQDEIDCTDITPLSAPKSLLVGHSNVKATSWTELQISIF